MTLAIALNFAPTSLFGPHMALTFASGGTPKVTTSPASELADQGEILGQLISGGPKTGQHIDIGIIFSKLGELREQAIDVFEHSWRVAVLTGEFVSCLEGMEDDQERRYISYEIFIGALLHDIGKIHIPVGIRDKGESLDEEEWSLMEDHPELGHLQCERLGISERILRIIRNHHERWDGTGYPDGLIEEKIPLTAQIVAIIDTWDAMTNDRPYEDKISWAEAIQTFEEERNMGQWNPELVDQFIEFMRAKMQAEQ
jgi:HD-GYP domain-containing protein (c-di-GMP phosphodiesterase class II)